jgi:hypothetical protein
VADRDGDFTVRCGDIRHDVRLKAARPWFWPLRSLAPEAKLTHSIV